MARPLAFAGCCLLVAGAIVTWAEPFGVWIAEKYVSRL